MWKGHCYFMSQRIHLNTKRVANHFYLKNISKYMSNKPLLPLLTYQAYVLHMVSVGVTFMQYACLSWTIFNMSEQNLAFAYNNVQQTYISIYGTYTVMLNVHQHISEYAGSMSIIMPTCISTRRTSLFFRVIKIDVFIHVCVYNSDFFTQFLKLQLKLLDFANSLRVSVSNELPCNI